MAARVPVYDSPQVAQTGLPLARFDAPPVLDFGSRQTQQLGEAMQRAGTAADAIGLDMQAQANQLRFDAAAQQAREAVAAARWGPQGYENLRGATALYRPDNQYLPDEYGQQVDKQFKAIADGLGNDAQRRVFSKYSGDLLASFREGAMAHVNREYQGYHLSVARGNIAQRTDEIGRSGGDTAAIERAINGRTEMQDGQVVYVEKGLRQSAFEAARLTGASEAEAAVMAQKSISNGLRLAILGALERNDVSLADGLLAKYGKPGYMDADDMLSVRSHITKQMDAQVGLTVATEAVRSVQPRMQPDDFMRARNIMVGQESGGHQLRPDGTPVTSSKGAIGVAQIMPATGPEAAKLAGLPWDEQRFRTDKEYNLALGTAYLRQQLQDFGGDLAKAYGAYNGGPGRVRDAEKRAAKSIELNKNDPAVQVRTWLDFMPRETQAYVTANMKAYNAGQGQPQAPTFAEIDDKLRADPRLANNPARYHAAREEASRQFEEQQKAIKQREEAAVATALRGLYENGGSFSGLPASARAAIPPKDLTSVMNAAERIAKGDDRTDPWLYQKWSTNPALLGKMTDDEFMRYRPLLSEADAKHFTNERAKQLGVTGASGGPGDLNSTAIKATVDARLRVLGVDPTPKDDGGSDAARVAAVRQTVDQYMYAAQREAGRKFTDAEVEKHVDALFAKKQVYSGWFSNTSGALLGMKAGDIPSTAKDSLKAEFKAKGIENPTDAQLLNAYFLLKLARK